MASYKVIDENGIFYTDKFGGELKKFILNEKITEKDVENGSITAAGLESLRRAGRVELLSDTKIDKSTQKKV